ncbi:MAG: diguanylate cyclase [Thermoanaerobaculia bacterium]|nr:diguanylate cyclase [Thermoanaerobaculia bacterium]
MKSSRSHRGWPRSVLLALVAGVAAEASLAAAAADPAAASHPFVRAFRDLEGLPQNTVHALALDRDGQLWAGTQDGLARYDGLEWVREQPAGVRGALFVRDLLTRHDGELWVATQTGGLLRRAEGRWVAIPAAPAELATARVNALAETVFGSEATLWVGTHDDGLFAFDGAAWRRFGEADGLPSARIWSLLGAPGGRRLWIGTQRGVAAIDPAGGVVSRPAGAPLASVSSLELTAATGAPTLWVGTYGDGLYLHRDERWTRLAAEDGLPSQFVTDLAPRAGEPDQVWIATDGGGLAWADASAVRAVDLGPQFASKAAYRLLETSEAEGAEALWVGTRNGGLLRVTERLWRTLSPPAAGPPPPITALCLDAADDGGDELWLGTDGEGLVVWRAGDWWRPRLRPAQATDPTVLAIVATRRLAGGRRLWVGTRNGGLDEWDGTRWATHDVASGALPSDLVQALVEVRAPGGDALWVGTREGLAVRDGAGWRRLAVAPEAAALSIQVLLAEEGTIDAPPTVWLGTPEGLWRLQGDARRHWSAAEGLPHPSVQALWLRHAPAGRRELWIGTDGGGLARLDPDRLDAAVGASPETGVPALPNPVVYGLTEDAAGRLYAATNQGVARFRPSRTGDPAAAEVEQFTVFHGLPVQQGSRGAVATDARGRVWLGTVGGVALLDPGRERLDTTPNRVRLTARLPSRGGTPLTPGAEVPAADGEVVFTYRLLSFVGEPLTRYRTELLGVDRAPTPWAAGVERQVSGLAPGRYLFRVWGRDAAGNVSEPAELAFRVLPAVWQTPWFVALALLSAAGALAAFVQRRARRHARRERELEEQVAERTAQLQEANERLARLSFLDPLTEVANRRRFDEQLESEWRRAARLAAPVAAIMIDIDEFKPYNDSYGHPRGDEVLRQVAELLAAGLARSGDLLARYGGEEFAVLLPATDEDGAFLLAESLRVQVAAARIEHLASSVAPYVTVSCGVAAAWPPRPAGARTLVAAADEALYAAKRAGRNRTERAGA